MRIIKCHVNNKVTYACFQLVKTGKEQLQVKAPWQTPRLYVSRFIFPRISRHLIDSCQHGIRVSPLQTRLYFRTIAAISIDVYTIV